MSNRIRFLEEEAKSWTLGHKIGLGIAALILLAAVVIWSQWPAKPFPEVIAAAPEVRQGDGSVVASRTFTPKLLPAPHIIPKGFKEMSRDTVTVAPTPAAAASGCPSVGVILSTVQKGNELRVVASSPDGTILSAKNEIIEPMMMPAPPHKWAAGLSYSTERETGVWLERDVGRLRLGAEVSKGQGKPRAELRVGIAF